MKEYCLEITENIEEDKALLLFQWLIDHLEYDYEKYENHRKNDFDNDYGSLSTLVTLDGVCYDYATLYASLTRSIGIPTKVVEGYYYLDDGSKEHHGWN